MQLAERAVSNCCSSVVEMLPLRSASHLYLKSMAGKLRRACAQLPSGAFIEAVRAVVNAFTPSGIRKN